MFGVLYRVFDGREFSGIFVSDGERLKFIFKDRLKDYEGITFLNAKVLDGKVVEKSWCILPAIQEYEMKRIYGKSVLSGAILYR